MDIVSGIVTYEPDLERLDQNLSAVARQVEAVVVFDNGSSNRAAVRDLVSKYPNAELMESPNNVGIARALNRIFARAKELEAAWVLTLDQDSVVPPGMVGELQDVANTHPTAALISPYIVDRNKLSADEYRTLALPRIERFNQAARKGAITSGALTNLAAVQAVGGFDDRLFIDYVDYDLNQKLMLAGFEILRANHTHLYHEVGKAEKTWLRVPRRDISGNWHLERFYSFGHSPTRCYYKARNRILFSKKYGRAIGVTNEGAWQIPQQVALTLIFESQRAEKLRAFHRGVRDGMRMRTD